MIFVEFTPPYSNKPKRVECCHKNEALLLADWLRATTTAREVRVLSGSMEFTELGQD